MPTWLAVVFVVVWVCVAVGFLVLLSSNGSNFPGE